MSRSFDFDGRAPPHGGYPREHGYGPEYYDGPGERRGPPDSYTSQYPSRPTSPYNQDRRNEFVVDERHLLRGRQSAVRDVYDRRSPAPSEPNSDDDEEDEDQLRNDEYDSSRGSNGTRGRGPHSPSQRTYAHPSIGIRARLPHVPVRTSSSFERGQRHYHPASDNPTLRIPYDSRKESRTPSLNTSSTETTFVGAPPLSSSSEAHSVGGGIKRKRSVTPGGRISRSRSRSPAHSRSRSGSDSLNVPGKRRSLEGVPSRRNSGEEERDDDERGLHRSASSKSASKLDPSRRLRRRLSPSISALGLNIGPDSLNKSRTSSARTGSGDDAADESDNNMAADSLR